MHPSILRNTLLSETGMKTILSLPRDDSTYASLFEILSKFQDIKNFASEIHTETHLIKPILKLFGYAYEAKPKFFEDKIKGPDIALFASEDKSIKASPLWGTKEYYDNTLGILLLKRYGRILDKGISGFYLEFENKIPIYQIIYLLKKIKTPWGILTNGRNWILIKKSVNFEKKLIEIDIESLLSEKNEEALHLFFHIFSLNGLQMTIPGILDEERNKLINILRDRKSFTRNSIQGLKKRREIYPKIISIYKNLIPDGAPSLTDAYLIEKKIEVKPAHEEINEQPYPINEYDMSDIFSYLFLKNEHRSDMDLEEIILGNLEKCTKEEILSLKILDMTPGFGVLTTKILECIAYLSFSLPYKERNTFVAEWEDEHMLTRYILNHILYGIERSYISFDILQNAVKRRFDTIALNYKPGSPLIGMSIKDIPVYSDSKNQMNLFNMNPGEIINDFRESYKLYFALSDKIKEDVELKKEIEVKLNTYRERISDVLDVITSNYFSKSTDKKRLQEVLGGLGGSEPEWESLRKKSWFIETKKIAKKYGFFHPEIEFPFLHKSAFNFIFVQPTLSYIWEEKPQPLVELTKAYIKSGMRYLKPDGKLIICTEKDEGVLFEELSKSKRYSTEIKSGVICLSKKANDAA